MEEKQEKTKKFDFNFLNIAMYTIFGIIILYVLKNLGIWQKIVQVLVALTPVYVGIIICWLSSPIAKKFKKWGMKDKTAAFVSLFIILGFLILVIAFTVPIATKEISSLIDDMPNIYNNAVSGISNLMNNIDSSKIDKAKIIDLSKQQLNFDLVKKYAGNIVGFSISTVKGIGSTIVAIFTTIIVSFFLVKDVDKYKAKVINYLSKGNKKSKKYRMYTEIDDILISYVKGIVLDSFIVGILITIVCLILKIKYALIFGIISMVLNLVPYFGALFSELIVALYALSTNGIYFAILTFALAILVQIIDANILQPNIVAKSVNLHPIAVLSGLIAFNILFGFFGMVIAVPALAVIKIILKYSVTANIDDSVRDQTIDKDVSNLKIDSLYSKRINDKK